MPRSRVRLFVFTALVAAGVPAVAFVGCIPGYTFGEAAGPGDGGGAEAAPGFDSSVDGTIDANAGDSSNAVDAPIDSPQDTAPPIPFDGGIVSVAVVDAGSKINSTGYGYQLHLVYAENDQHFWYFYIDDTAGQIKTLRSADFVTWVGGAAIPLSGSYTMADGNNFSVAYANLGGTDVVHIVVDASGPGYMTLHIRAAITGGALSSATAIPLPNSTNGGACANDGPATTVTPAGLVYDVTAWNNHGSDPMPTTCDTDIYLASGADLGTSWNAGTFEYDGYYVSLPDINFAHDLVDMPEAGTVMLLYTDYDNAEPENSPTDFSSIGWALSPSFDGGAPDCGCGVDESAPFELFTSSNQEASYDDWSACRLADTDIHVVRHVLTSTGTSVSAFQEDVYNGSTWQPTSNPPASSNGLSDTGVALVSGTDPTKGMLLVTLGNDYALNVSKWTSAGGWTQAGKLAGGTNVRQSLAGSGCGSVRPAVFWTETVGAANEIESADLEGFLQ